MKPATVGLPVLAVLTLLLLARCVAAPSSHSAAGHGWPPVAATSQSQAAPTSATYNATDVAWLQLIIPMTRQALPVFDAAPRRTSNPLIVQLAAQMGNEHRAQLRTLQSLLRRAGVPDVNMHAGHNMPGMVTIAELGDGTRTKDAAFDRFFTEHIGEYLRQSVSLAEGVQGAGADRDTKAFAVTVGRARAADLDRLTGAPKATLVGR
ncbi:Uncharacterized conserved protein, DUF305 family [Sinosporangium album]|uniref:Uncharacterized conserved protein, DUF305 family n=1 Tax=Sinosporangium album TaxID=504805 RepID=A0A1G7T324_9ACTN|nr:DUF305 domain-containing protein [Sinosporangium album]SDG29726.1 Uncharacterized conserved protein, DUF305 family [Sinosporangium album]